MTHTIAHITPPIVQTRNGPQAMVAIGSDIGDSSGSWRSTLYINPDDIQEFNQNAANLQRVADDHDAQENLAARLTWPKRAVRVSLYTTGYAMIDIAPQAQAMITHYGSDSYGYAPRTYNLQETADTTLGNEHPVRIKSAEPSTLMHKAIHHLLIDHSHGIDPTDNMPPASPLTITSQRIALPNAAPQIRPAP